MIDIALPNGLISGGTGDMRYAHTMAFTTLVFFQLFNVFNAHSLERSAFHKLFVNGWLWLAVAISAALQVAVVYTPFLQQAFRTAPLTLGDWLLCVGAGSSVLLLSELRKLVMRTAIGR